MMKNKLTVTYWGDTELAFVEFARNLCKLKSVSFNLIKINHHLLWFTSERSYFKNIIHLSCTFMDVILKGSGGGLVCFGTNTSRILFFMSFLFKDVHYIYNEMPSFSKFNLAFYIDIIIFKYAKNISVSTIDRANFISSIYKIKRSINVLENVSFIKIPQVEEGTRPGRILFSGSITSKRFSDEDFSKMKVVVDFFKCPIDVYGEVTGDISDQYFSLISLKGKVSHQSMLEAMRAYNFGLLSYYLGEPNYDYCAPLKLFEYIAFGCRVISLNRNIGLIKIAERYPGLIFFATDWTRFDDVSFSLSSDEFKLQRERFLNDAIESNCNFAKRIIK